MEEGKWGEVTYMFLFLGSESCLHEHSIGAGLCWLNRQVFNVLHVDGLKLLVVLVFIMIHMPLPISFAVSLNWHT
jgi:hypothetical protein